MNYKGKQNESWYYYSLVRKRTECEKIAQTDEENWQGEERRSNSHSVEGEIQNKEKELYYEVLSIEKKKTCRVVYLQKLFFFFFSLV